MALNCDNVLEVHLRTDLRHASPSRLSEAAGLCTSADPEVHLGPLLDNGTQSHLMKRALGEQGSQFVRGFGGVGGLLRYAVDTSQFEVDEDDLDDREWDSDEDI